MPELLKFEFRRNLKYIIAFIAVIAVLGVSLMIVDKDTEELVITLSILLFILPYSAIITSLVKTLIQDTGGKTRHLYMSLPKSIAQIIGAKILYAFICFTFYFIVIILIPNQFMFLDKIIMMLIFVTLFGLVLHLTALVILFRKRRIH